VRCMGSGANARVAGDDEEMQRFVPIEGLFKGRHFDRQIIVLCHWELLATGMESIRDGEFRADLDQSAAHESARCVWLRGHVQGLPGAANYTPNWNLNPRCACFAKANTVAFDVTGLSMNRIDGFT
jgi:hypothetical protein